MAEPAPYFAEIAGNPDGICHWLQTADGLRIRVGHWPLEHAKGTVLIFPGRTEYIEKYGLAAGELSKRGFASLAIDWRGQGLADRMLPDPAVGHVRSFADYQFDVAIVINHARTLGLPEPYHLMAHSMGGCIGLRALHEHLPVKTAVFSAPMWGIKMAPHMRPFAKSLTKIADMFGFSNSLPPGQSKETYVLRESAANNTLTSDPEHFEILQQQIRAQPDLALGGPSLHWLGEALREMHALSTLPAPDVPCLTFLGTDEEIVDPANIHALMNRWRCGDLVLLEGGRHEVMMERLELRDRVFNGAATHFDQAETTAKAS